MAVVSLKYSRRFIFAVIELIDYDRDKDVGNTTNVNSTLRKVIRIFNNQISDPNFPSNFSYDALKVELPSLKRVPNTVIRDWFTVDNRPEVLKFLKAVSRLNFDSDTGNGVAVGNKT